MGYVSKYLLFMGENNPPVIIIHFRNFFQQNFKWKILIFFPPKCVFSPLAI